MSLQTGPMAVDPQHKLLLFAAAAALRLLLFSLFPALPALLSGRVEVATPVTSFKRCTCRHDRVARPKLPRG
jgi:hypothetical protein